MNESDVAAETAESIGLNEITIIALIGALIVGIMVRYLTMWVAPTLLKKLIQSENIQRKTVKDSDKALGTAAGSAMTYFLVLQMIDSIQSGSDRFAMPNVLQNIIPNLFQFIIALALVIWAIRLVEIVQDVVMMFDDDGETDGTDKTLISALQSILRFGIVFVGSVFIADALGFELTSLIAGLGISGLALALAAKDSISNFFGAVTVLLDRPFQVGDWILVGSSQGEVIEINLRTTIIRTGIDTVITIPNANLVSTPVENFGKRRWRRWQNQLHFDINSNPKDVENFRNTVIELITNNSATMKEESSWCRVNNISATSVEIAINLYWDVKGGADERAEKEKFLLNIMQVAKENNLQFYDNRIRQQR
jgi:MscS family membrane protein